jgi:hypothetical protein
MECNTWAGREADLRARFHAVVDTNGLPVQLDLLALYEAKASLQRAYVLGHLGRAVELLSAAEQARTLLLSGRPATLASFSQSVERELYLEALTRRAQAQAMLGDSEAALATCDETVRDVEKTRYQVNSPYQQSSFQVFLHERRVGGV